MESRLDLCLDVPAVAGDEVAADASDVQPLQSPFPEDLARFGVLLQLEFYTGASYDQVPNEVALA